MIHTPVTHRKRARIMGAGPVEDSILKPQQPAVTPAPAEQQGTTYFSKDVPQPDEAENKVAELYSPQEELIKAMHLYIEALTDYVHKPDVRMIAAAQEGYIGAQTRYIARNLGKN